MRANLFQTALHSELSSVEKMAERRVVMMDEQRAAKMVGPMALQMVDLREGCLDYQTVGYLVVPMAVKRVHQMVLTMAGYWVVEMAEMRERLKQTVGMMDGKRDVEMVGQMGF